MDTSTARHPFLALPGLTASTLPLVTRLLGDELMPIADVAEVVAVYRRVIQDSVAAGGRADLALGMAIADALEAMLARVDDRTEEDALRIIQVAAILFVIENDGFGSDLQHEDGLFGDARVVNAMLRWFGRDDLLIALPTSLGERRRTTDAAHNDTVPELVAVAS